ncbi:MAG: carboxymuconolactone decarboxylase family protein [Candidatus Atribacteria bacterium]|nr:carboxymuconolactone decarboxylase family protein [Candidatus Atribacteria bacterium]
MSTQPGEFFPEYREQLKKLKEEAPATLEGFNRFYRQIMSEGVLDPKIKELITLGIGVAIHCENCIMLHTRGALKAGASREEVLEAAAVGVVMGGGPAFTFLPLVIKTIEAVEEKQL